MRDGVLSELGLERGEMLKQKCREVMIFTEREQVLLVQRVDEGLCVLFDDAVGDDNRSALVCGTNPVHGETSGQTRHGAEQALERL